MCKELANSPNRLAPEEDECPMTYSEILEGFFPNGDKDEIEDYIMDRIPD